MPCDSKDFCESVKEICGRDTGKGLIIQTMVDIKSEDLKESYYLAYKTDARSTPRILRFCPACGTNLFKLYLSDGRLVKTKKKPSKSQVKAK